MCHEIFSANITQSAPFFCVIAYKVRKSNPKSPSQKEGVDIVCCLQGCLILQVFAFTPDQQKPGSDPLSYDCSSQKHDKPVHKQHFVDCFKFMMVRQLLRSRHRKLKEYKAYKNFCKLLCALLFMFLLMLINRKNGKQQGSMSKCSWNDFP